MARKAMVVDLNRCIGCKACTVACKQENNVPLGAYWNFVRNVGPIGTFPDLEMYFLPVMCQQCQNPKCVSVCPSGASRKRSDGIVLIDKDTCIGCKACLEACPYDVRFYNKESNVVEKCTACTHLLEQGKEPACVLACCAKARFFGDLDDKTSAPAKTLALAENTEIQSLTDMGNVPVGRYILHPKNAKWQSIESSETPLQ